jgi:aconitase B
LTKNELPKEIKLTVFRVDGEINTDDLSPATEAWSRPDIQAINAYHVPASDDMIKLDAMESPFPLPDELIGKS